MNFFAIPQDEWQNGEYAICSCCGAHIRYGVKVAGAVYGLQCASAKGLLGKKITRKLMQKIESYKSFLKACIEAGKLDNAYGWARAIDRELGLKLPNSQNYVMQVWEVVK